MAISYREKPAGVEEAHYAPAQRRPPGPLVWFAVGCAALGLGSLPAWLVVEAAKRPLVSGEVLTLRVFSRPVTSTEDTSSPAWEDIEKNAPGSRVDVYDGFIVVKMPKVGRLVVPNGFYSRLQLKP